MHGNGFGQEMRFSKVFKYSHRSISVVTWYFLFSRHIKNVYLLYISLRFFPE
jgi:hypothetical protein